MNIQKRFYVSLPAAISYKIISKYNFDYNKQQN